MMRIVMPLLLLAAAIGLFVVYTNPQYQLVQTQTTQAAQLDDALYKAQQLQGLRDQLMAKRNAFAASDLQKLQNVLPDNVDNIRLILDVNNIAYRHGLTLTNLKLNTSTTDATSGNSTTVVGSTGPTGSLEMGFSVTTDYNTFIAFLQDLEHSERLIDITKISFTNDGSTPNATTYSITFRTYWLH